MELEQGQEFGDHERRSRTTTPNTLKHSMEQAVLDFAERIVLSVSEIFDRQLRENVPVPHPSAPRLRLIISNNYEET